MKINKVWGISRINLKEVLIRYVWLGYVLNCWLDLRGELGQKRLAIGSRGGLKSIHKIHDKNKLSNTEKRKRQ